LGHDDECGGSEEEEDTEAAVTDDSSNGDDEDDGNGDNGGNGDDTQSSNLFPTDNNRDNTDDGNDQEESLCLRECQVAADCFTGIVTDIVDGDTLDFNNVRIRLSLVNTPEQGDSGNSEAKQFTESRCPIGSKALVDEDDGQKEEALIE
jgi:hypothetical protein